MKSAGIVFFLSAVMVLAQTNRVPCCRYPLRSFSGDTVNLAPLFQWWETHASDNSTNTGDDYSDRPLAAWKRITGVKTEAFESSWLVNAVVATDPATHTNEQIVLKNPPAAEEQQYYALKALLPQYDAQITNDARAYQADLKAQQKADARAAADAKSRNVIARTYTGNYDRLAASDQDAASAALSDEHQYEQARELALKQLTVIPSAHGHYEIDCFALEIGRNRDGTPIFDMGIPVGSP